MTGKNRIRIYGPLVALLRLASTRGDVATGRAFVRDQPGGTLGRGDPQHLLHRGPYSAGTLGCLLLF
jgi:hypothetical protein